MKNLEKKLINSHFYLIGLEKKRIKVFMYLAKNLRMMKVMNLMIS